MPEQSSAFSDDYKKGSETTTGERKTAKLPSLDIKVESESYGLAKPRRKIIRANIASDKS